MFFMDHFPTHTPTIKSMYRRYHINTRSCPPQSPQVPKFTVKVDRLKFAKMILHELMSCTSVEEMKATIKSRPCMYGVFSRPAGGFAPKSNLCVSCYRCVLENPEIVRILPNPQFQQLGATFMTPQQVSTIWYESTTGRVPVRGAGYNGPFSGYGFDGMWTDMSEIVRPTRDGIHGREFISTTVDLGRKLSKLTFDENGNLRTRRHWSLRIPIPIMLDSLPVDHPNLHTGLAQAANELETFYLLERSTADGIEGAYQSSTARIIPIVTIDELRKGIKDLSVYSAIEVECRTVDDCRNALQMNKTAVFVRVNSRPGVEDLICEFVAAGADVIHLAADWKGIEEGTSPRSIKDILRAVHTRLVQINKRDEVTLIASGGIVAAEHVPKAIICGADIVALNAPLITALQGEVISTERGDLTIELPYFDGSWAKRRIVNLIGSWHNQLLEILGAMGLREVRRLRGEVGRAMFAEDLEKEFCETICGSSRE